MFSFVLLIIDRHPGVIGKQNYIFGWKKEEQRYLSQAIDCRPFNEIQPRSLSRREKWFNFRQDNAQLYVMIMILREEH